MRDCMEWLRQLTALPGPAGDESEVSRWLIRETGLLGCAASEDPKGNVVVSVPVSGSGPSVLVTAHMDEIALMVTRIEADGKVRVAPLGGVYTWKWGEGPVDIRVGDGTVTAVLSFGSIHTNSEESVVEFARHNPLNWERAWLFTGLSAEELQQAGVRPGRRVVLAQARRTMTEFGQFVASYFVDDRVDVAVWLMALEALQSAEPLPLGSLTFAATASEEVGGLGAKYILSRGSFDICVALEIGPRTPDADFPIDEQPTIWVRDGYCAMDEVDGRLLTGCCEELGQTPHWQYLSRGGSDASCAVSAGLAARSVTLGVPVENSHGYEIMHRCAPAEMARLLLAYLQKAGG